MRDINQLRNELAALDKPAASDVLTWTGGKPVWTAPAGAHDAVTLAADADTVLGLSTQQITLDTQSANTVFAGATSGGAADPSFRALVAADIPVNCKVTTVVGGADTDVANVTDQTIFSKDITTASGDLIHVDFWFTLNNAAAGSRTYTFTLDFDSLFDSEISVAVGAGGVRPIHGKAILDIRSSSLVYAVFDYDSSTSATASGADITMDATSLKAVTWGTSASDATGTTTVTLVCRTSNATGTQTLQFHGARITRLTPT